MWIIRNIPTPILHAVIAFILTLFSYELAIGAALGRESLRLGEWDKEYIRKDTLKDLLCDVIGLLCGLLVLAIYKLF